MVWMSNKLKLLFLIQMQILGGTFESRIIDCRFCRIESNVNGIECGQQQTLFFFKWKKNEMLRVLTPNICQQGNAFTFCRFLFLLRGNLQTSFFSFFLQINGHFLDNSSTTSTDVKTPKQNVLFHYKNIYCI